MQLDIIKERLLMDLMELYMFYKSDTFSDEKTLMYFTKLMERYRNFIFNSTNEIMKKADKLSNKQYKELPRN